MKSSEWLEHKQRVLKLISDYEKGLIGLTNNQVSDMWKVNRDLDRVCPHAEKIERHYIDNSEDEYSQTHYWANCRIVCRYCDAKIEEQRTTQNGIYCCVTKEHIYFTGDYGGRSLKSFNLLILNGQRTNVEMVPKYVTKHTKMWEPKETVVLETRPPVVKPKPEYVGKLEALEVAAGITSEKVPKTFSSFKSVKFDKSP